jgi:hypothetical protein
MQVGDSDSGGTVIGYVPSGASHAIPYSSLSTGYAVLNPKGQWSGFTILSSGPNGFAGIVQLSHQANQILVSDSQGVRLVNPVDGTVTPISQLIPPASQSQFSNFSQGQIDDRGDILVTSASSTGDVELLLTPPGLAAPAVIPEPSTILVFAVLGVAAIVRWGIR